MAARAWVFAGKAPGVQIWELTLLRVGEVAAVRAFGLSWLLAGFHLTAPARPGIVAAQEPLLATSAAGPG